MSPMCSYNHGEILGSDWFHEGYLSHGSCIVIDISNNLNQNCNDSLNRACSFDKSRRKQTHTSLSRVAHGLGSTLGSFSVLAALLTLCSQLNTEVNVLIRFYLQFPMFTYSRLNMGPFPLTFFFNLFIFILWRESWSVRQVYSFFSLLNWYRSYALAQKNKQ